MTQHACGEVAAVAAVAAAGPAAIVDRPRDMSVSN